MAEWITDRKPDDERVVRVKLPSGIYPAWWKGVGWKCGPGEWLNSDAVEGWQEAPDMNEE